MLARIFINRPVLACVLSVVILLLGGISAGLLPVAEYPEVTPPIVRVSAYYPGANAQVLADTVAAPIEQQVNGVERMLYMTSQSNNDGSYTLDAGPYLHRPPGPGVCTLHHRRGPPASEFAHYCRP